MGTEVEITLRLLLAAALGAAIGWQREKSHKPAGFRTHILICLGSATFTVVSISAFGADVARVAAGVVTGIGFLGAGTILHREKGAVTVSGLTTAATIWATAAVGLAAGVGMYIVSAVTAVLILIVLSLPHHVQ